MVTLPKWSRYRGKLLGEVTLSWRGGNVIDALTETTDEMRVISRAEFRRVYEVWPDYRAGVKKRSDIVQVLGVQNSTWIIPTLHYYEHLTEP